MPDYDDRSGAPWIEATPSPSTAQDPYLARLAAREEYDAKQARKDAKPPRHRA